MEKAVYSQKKLIWINIVFFTVTTVAALVGCPWYLSRYGISLPEILLCSFFTVATGMSITAGYHRLYAHVTYKANPIVQFLYLFFGAAAFEQSALVWACQHRDHHRYVDTDRDPYSIKKGFFYAHIGWLIFWKHTINFENVRDLQQSRMIMNQYKYYHIWAVVAGILTPVLIGALTGHMLGALLFAVCFRLTLVYHATFSINSICHMFGKATYDIYSTAKDHWLVAFLTNGEGFHNFHHRFPSDFRNGVRWYHWDPSKWLIAFLGKFGFASDLKTISSYRILAARLAAENQRVHDVLKETVDNAYLHKTLEAVRGHYEQLKHSLVQWEMAQKEYHLILQARIIRRSSELKENASSRLQEARRQFKTGYSQWVSLVSRPPLDLQHALLGRLAPA